MIAIIFMNTIISIALNVKYFSRAVKKWDAKEVPAASLTTTMHKRSVKINKDSGDDNHVAGW